MDKAKEKNKCGDSRGMSQKCQQNLIPFTSRSKEEHSDLSRKGQIKSVESRKENRSLKQSARELLSLEVPDKNIRLLKENGFPISDNMSLSDQIVIKLILMARNGNISAAKLLNDMTKEEPSGIGITVDTSSESRVQIYLPEIEKSAEE